MKLVCLCVSLSNSSGERSAVPKLTDKTSMQRLKTAAMTGTDIALPVARRTPVLLMPANISARNPWREQRSMGCKHRENTNFPEDASYCSSQMRSLDVRSALMMPWAPKPVDHLNDGFRSKLTEAKHAGYPWACTLAMAKFSHCWGVSPCSQTQGSPGCKISVNRTDFGGTGGAIMFVQPRLACSPTVCTRSRFCGNHALVFKIQGKTRHMGARTCSSWTHSSHKDEPASPESVDC